MSSPLIDSLFDESESRPLTVTEINSQVRSDLERRYSSVWLEGEVTNFVAHGSGHWYFSLRDDSSQLKAVCFRGTNSRIKFKPSNGVQVRVRGRLTVYEPSGNFQIVVESLEPAGEGALRAMFEQIEKKLAAEGLFDPELKRPLPFLPRRIGVVTSATGAAFDDILRELGRHSSTISVLLVPALVQGENAGASLKQAIEMANEYSRLAPDGKKLEALIVGRGGGSMEDLWAFNEEALARAIRASEIPVISAVGHEIDTTISDKIADVRAATPTAAAQMLSAGEDRIRTAVSQGVQRMSVTVRNRMVHARHKVEMLSSSSGLFNFPFLIRDSRVRLENQMAEMTAAVSLLLSDMGRRLTGAIHSLSPAKLSADLNEKKGRFDVLVHRGSNGIRRVVGRKREAFGLRTAALEALSPLRVLNRGYSITLDASGSVLSSVEKVKEGETLKVRLADGELDAKTIAKRKF